MPCRYTQLVSEETFLFAPFSPSPLPSSFLLSLVLSELKEGSKSGVKGLREKARLDGKSVILVPFPTLHTILRKTQKLNFGGRIMKIYSEEYMRQEKILN